MDKEKLQKVLDAVPDMYFILDEEGILKGFKPSRSTAPLVPPGQFLGRKLEEFLPVEIALEAMESVRRTLETQKEHQMSYALEYGGQLQYFDARLSPLGEDEILTIVRDVTEHRRNEELLRALINASTDMAILVDKDGRILALNDQMALFHHTVPGTMLGTCYWDYLDAEKASVRRERLERVFGTGQPARVVDVSGEQVFEISSNPIQAPGRQVTAVAFFIRDITEKVRADEELIESEARYRHLFEANPIPMYIHDIDTLMILDVNRAMVKNYGYTRSELTAMTIRDIRPAEEVEGILKSIRELKLDQAFLGQWRHLKKDGTVIDVEVTSSDFPFVNRRARLVLCNDVTRQVTARKALAESEEKFRTIFNTSPDAISLTSMDTGRHVEVNQGFALMTGYSVDELLEKTAPELGIWVDPSQRQAIMEELANTGRVDNREITVRSRSGEVRSGLFSARSLQLGGGRHMLALSRDITDYKAAQDALVESEEKFRQAFLTNPDPMIISRIEDGVFLEVNDGFVAATGYTREEVLGKTSTELNLWTDTEQRNRMVKTLREKGKLENFETTMRSKGGRSLIALLSAVIISVGGEKRMLTISREITDLKEVQEKLQSSLQEKEILLKEIHHRVKNNLQVISGLLNLQAHHITDSTGREIYKESQNRVITMALIHESLYQSHDLGMVHFGDYIRNLCENLMVSYGADRRGVGLKVEAAGAEIVVDTAIPCGLIVNELVTNTLKHAFPDSRKGTIIVTFRTLPDGMFELTVGDDGIGIPEGVDIHQTPTLGMQLVSVLVQQLGGTLEMEAGQGTTFTVTFREYHEAGTVLY